MPFTPHKTVINTKKQDIFYVSFLPAQFLVENLGKINVD